MPRASVGSLIYIWLKILKKREMGEEIMAEFFN